MITNGRGGHRANGAAASSNHARPSPAPRANASSSRQCGLDPACRCPLPRFGEAYGGPLCNVCVGYIAHAEGAALCRELHDAEGFE
jgi:hypothetical protein